MVSPTDAAAMHAADLEKRIDVLEREQQQLRTREGHTSDSDTLADEVRRLAEIRVELNQLFDLKRRQRAAANADEDPVVLMQRTAAQVEGYRQ